MNRSAGLCLAIASLIILAGALPPRPVSAASSSDFQSTQASIDSAFQALHQAAQSGGNVSSLVGVLNVALGLVTKATGENPSNPSQATADLQNATSLAQQVLASAPSIAQSGAAARQALETASILSAVVIAASGVLLYIFGERIFRRLWLFLYSGFVVKKIG